MRGQVPGSAGILPAPVCRGVRADGKSAGSVVALPYTKAKVESP